jgi:arylsulfatase
LPILQGKRRAGHEAIFWQINKNGGGRAVRTDKWKLVKVNPKSPWELYDMKADRTELNDLADKYPVKAKELSRLYDGWIKRYNLPA